MVGMRKLHFTARLHHFKMKNKRSIRLTKGEK
ncbi:hypothetical protein BBR47_17700 [Brevibacillus brevis NBRC 100599]|uniref:Uncharacterized protein n=1 Tax=Brevibacillus brevis (strain 47 / JCM 6285 / NBRC 100599) TaxID=358681 RepID=C0ZAD8_BREBN|nr:hypothetical protein BBR47_17700 [Brevibacillus brevis NBRC 100599]